MRYGVFLWLAALQMIAAAAPAQSRRIDPLALQELPSADVVILGEVHDNPVHHAQQAIAVGAINARALVFEMLTEEQALRIRADMLGDAQALIKALGWAETGWPDFAMYYPIFTAVEMPAIFGGALPRAHARQAMDSSAAEVFGGGAALFGLDRALDDHEQIAREALQMAAHCDALPVDLLPGMVEVQRLRDAALARAVIAAMAETDGPVAVITGNGHARTDWGVPRALQAAAPDLVVLSVGQLEPAPENAPPYDLWLETGVIARDDPCAAFDQD